MEAYRFKEHTDEYQTIQSLKKEKYHMFFSKEHKGKDVSLPCYTLTKDHDNSYHIKTGYFIGIDWLDINDSYLCIKPKLNTSGKQIDFIQILFNALQHEEISEKVKELVYIQWDAKHIPIEQKEDILTPFLIAEFLALVTARVRKGLKKSYYPVLRKLNARVKGKLLVSKTIKHNISKSQALNTYCSYEEFGLNTPENKLLKKTLLYIQEYLSTVTHTPSKVKLVEKLNYVLPAFSTVSNDIDTHSSKNLKHNAFYQEYKEALHLADLILKRFGYNIENASSKLVGTPPFWIDMSKLFELHVYSLLKKGFGNGVSYHDRFNGREIDFLLNTEKIKMIIEAKYKPRWKDTIVFEDIQQLSTYARMKSIYNELGIEKDKIIEALIVYPNLTDGELNTTSENVKSVNLRDYVSFYKLGVKMPLIA